MKRAVSIIIIMLTLISLNACKVKENNASPAETSRTKNETNTVVSVMYKCPSENNDYIYDFNEEGITLVKYTGKDKEISVPQTIDNVYITEIGKECFAQNQNIVSVEIPHCVRTVDSYAFYNCTNLSSVIIKEGVEKIAPSAFDGCSSLKEISFPSSVKEIGLCAFSNCTNLETVSFVGARPLNIGASAFSFTPVSKVVLPEGTASISNAAFAHCKKLKEVYVPESVKDIKNNAFKNSPKVVLYIHEGSYGVIFAKTSGENYKIMKGETI